LTALHGGHVNLIGRDLRNLELGGKGSARRIGVKPWKGNLVEEQEKQQHREDANRSNGDILQMFLAGEKQIRQSKGKHNATDNDHCLS